MTDGWLGVKKLVTDRSTCYAILERNHKGNVFMYVRVFESVCVNEGKYRKSLCMTVNNVNNKTDIGEYLG